jgi:hypothetical protein
METQNIEMAMGILRSEMHKMLTDISKSIDSRIKTMVKSSMQESAQFHFDGKLRALEKLTTDKPLTNDQLTRLYNDIMGSLEDLKHNSNGYALYDQMQQLSTMIQTNQTQVKELSNNVHKIINDSYIKSNITPQELQSLWKKSECTPDMIAKKFSVSQSMVYKILNCEDSNLKRRNEIRLFMEDLINKNATV